MFFSWHLAVQQQIMYTTRKSDVLIARFQVIHCKIIKTYDEFLRLQLHTAACKFYLKELLLQALQRLIHFVVF